MPVGRGAPGEVASVRHVSARDQEIELRALARLRDAFPQKTDNISATSYHRQVLLTGQVPELTEIRPEVPLTVQPVVTRALSVDPGGRFPTAGVFVAALKKATTRVAAPGSLIQLILHRKRNSSSSTVSVTHPAPMSRSTPLIAPKPGGKADAVTARTMEVRSFPNVVISPSPPLTRTRPFVPSLC